MLLEPSNLYHFYNQGNNRQRIFTCSEDYSLFLKMYKKLVAPYTDTLAWCLMPNHFHFLIHTDERCIDKIKQGDIFIDPVSNGNRKLLSGYAQIFNRLYGRTGSLFRQKTKAKCLSEIEIIPGVIYPVQDYVSNCFHYIHQNPVAAMLVANAEDWEFSSFRDYSGQRNDSLCRKDLATKYCGYNPLDFMINSQRLIDSAIIKEFTNFKRKVGPDIIG